jgi:hypothetical protein
MAIFILLQVRDGNQRIVKIKDGSIDSHERAIVLTSDVDDFLGTNLL